ncbi:hypothetical protein [Endozoicomonas sp. Mp262]|uniref:hypothetical protein n=1 Tax=Endozoicomonas sp. Mp262 TaxID=2919499 RepID=UPI0021DAA498
MTQPCPVDRDERQYAREQGIAANLQDFIHDQIKELTDEPWELLSQGKNFELCGDLYTPFSFLVTLFELDLSPEKAFERIAAHHLIDTCEDDSLRYDLEQTCQHLGYID